MNLSVGFEQPLYLLRRPIFVLFSICVFILSSETKETIEITGIEEIIGKRCIQLNLNWYREPKRTKDLNNSTDSTKWKTYVEKLGICVTTINGIVTSITFYLNKYNEGFSWVDLVLLLQRNLAVFGDLTGLERCYGKGEIRSSRKMAADLDNKQVSLTNFLISWQKVNSDIETIQDRRLQLKCQKTLDTNFKLTDTQKVLDSEKKDSEIKEKALYTLTNSQRQLKI